MTLHKINYTLYIVLLTYHDNIQTPLDLLLFDDSITTAFVIRNGMVSIVIGTIFITVGTKVVVKPINLLSDAAKKVATGDFTIQVKKDGDHDAIAALIDNFNLMVMQLSKNENLQKDFTSNLSHEFKTPISSIAGYAELLKTPNLSEEKRMEYAQIITNQTTRLTKLSANLLKLSELDHNAIKVSKTNFSLDEQIRDAILLLQTEWEEKEITLDIELEELDYIGEKELLYQVWVNMIDNAIKFTKEYGTIKVRLYQKEQIVIEIEDTGIGIDSEHLVKIFERFYKADSSHSSKGTGLGLSIVKKIVELHEGSIQAESIENIGTKFTIKLQS